MIFPLRTDCPLRSTPYVNYALVLINVVVFALQKLGDAGALGGWSPTQYALDPGNPTLPAFFTYQFLHGGWMHLIMNMVFLYIFGNNVSDKLGQLQYLMFYLAGGVFAGVGFVVTSSPIAGAAGQYAPIVGASGAIAAVTGAFVVLVPRSNITVLYFFILIGAAEIPALWFVLFFFAQDVVLQVIGAGTGVAHVAHISGSIFGFSVSLALLAGRLLDRDQFDMLALIQRWNRRRQYRDAVAKGWNPYAAMPGMPGPAKPMDERETRLMELRAEVSEAMAHRNVDRAVQLYMQLRQMDASRALSRNAQLDIANHLAGMGRYADAAGAYELFLQAYPQAEQHAHVQLLTGVLYSRYLDDPRRAAERIEAAFPRLTSPRDIELARTELEKLRTQAGT